MIKISGAGVRLVGGKDAAGPSRSPISFLQQMPWENTGACISAASIAPRISRSSGGAGPVSVTGASICGDRCA